MAYQTALLLMTLSDLKGHYASACLIKCNVL